MINKKTLSILVLLIASLLINPKNSEALVLPPTFGGFDLSLNSGADSTGVVTIVGSSLAAAQKGLMSVTKTQETVKKSKKNLFGKFASKLGIGKRKKMSATSEIVACDIADLSDANSIKTAIYQLFLAYPSKDERKKNNYRKKSAQFYQDSLLEIDAALLALEKELFSIRNTIKKLPKDLRDGTSGEEGEDELGNFKNILVVHETLDEIVKLLEELTALKAHFLAAKIISQEITPAPYDKKSDKKNKKGKESSSLLNNNMMMAKAVVRSSKTMAFAQLGPAKTGEEYHPLGMISATSAAGIKTGSTASPSTTAQPANASRASQIINAKEAATSATVPQKKSVVQGLISTQKTAGVDLSKAVEALEESEDYTTEEDEDYEFDPGSNPFMKLKEMPVTDAKSVLAGSAAKIEDLVVLDEINDLVVEALEAHSIAKAMPSYRSVFAEYDKYKKMHERSIEALEASEQCVFQYLNRYYGDQHIKLWSGQKLTGKDVANHTLRKGLSGWLVKAFEIAKANEVPPLSVEDIRETDVSFDIGAEEFGSLEKTTSLPVEEKDNLSDDEKKEMRAKNRKADLLSWNLGSEASQMLVEDQYAEKPNWGVPTKNFPIWTDQKSYYTPYIEGKYTNIREYVGNIDIKPTVHSLVGAILTVVLDDSMKQAQAQEDRVRISDMRLATDRELEKFRELLDNVFEEENELEQRFNTHTVSLYDNLDEETKSTLSIAKTNREQRLSPYQVRKDALTKELQEARELEEFYSQSINDLSGKISKAKSELKNKKFELEHKKDFLGEENVTETIDVTEEEVVNKVIIENGTETVETSTELVTTTKKIESENVSIEDAEKERVLAERRSKIAGKSLEELKAMLAEIREKIKDLESKIAAVDLQMAPVNAEYTSTISNVETSQQARSVSLADMVKREFSEFAGNRSLSEEVYRPRLLWVREFYNMAIDTTSLDTTLAESLFDTTEDEVLGEIIRFYGHMATQARDRNYAALRSGDYAETHNQIDVKITPETTSSIRQDQLVKKRYRDVYGEDFRITDVVSSARMDRLVSTDTIVKERFQELYLEKYLEALLGIRNPKVNYYSQLRIDTAEMVSRTITQSETMLIAARGHAQTLVDKAKEDMFKLEDDLFLPSGHSLVVQRHKELIDELQNMSVKELIKTSIYIEQFSPHAAIMEIVSKALQKTIINAICKDNHCYEPDTDYFIGAVGKIRDFSAPFAPPSEYLPPIREAFYFDETNFFNLPKMGTEVTREDFLNHEGRVPEVWTLILRPNTYVEQDINLKEVLEQGGEGASFLGGGTYPCNSNNLTVGVDTQSKNYVINSKLSGERPTCQEVEAQQKGVGSTALFYMIHNFEADVSGPVFRMNASNLEDLLGFKFKKKPSGTIAENTSELGTFLQFDGEKLRFNPIAYNTYSTINSLADAAANDQNATRTIQDELIIKAAFNRNQFGNFLKFVETEMTTKQAKEELELEIEEMKKTLIEILQKIGFEPNPDFDLNKPEDYTLIRNKIIAVKNSVLSTASEKMNKINVTGNTLGEQRADKLNNTITALKKDRNCIVALTDQSPSDSALDQQLLTEEANQRIEEEAGKRADDEFNKSLRTFARSFCAIY